MMVGSEGQGPFLSTVRSRPCQWQTSESLPDSSHSRRGVFGYLELPGKRSMAFIDDDMQNESVDRERLRCDESDSQKVGNLSCIIMAASNGWLV
jgi:hypothetical protein